MTMDSPTIELNNKKLPKRKPNLRQKKALDELVGNGGNITKAMIAAGYSPATANTPQKLTESKGWKELMEENMPDELLTTRHAELLNKREKTVLKVGDETVTIDLGVDVQAVSKGLDMAYKLKGSYAPEKSVRVDLKVEGTPENIALIQEFETKRLAQLQDGNNNSVAGSE